VVAEWESLCSQDSGDGFFRRPAWYLSWIRNIRPDVQPFVITVRREGKLVALAPFCVAAHNWLNRVLMFAGNDVVCGEYLDVLARPQCRPQAVEAILQTLTGENPVWDTALFQGARPAGSLFSEVSSWAGQQAFAMRAAEDAICPFIDLPQSLEDFLAGCGRKRRQKLIRVLRRFEEQSIEIKTFHKPQELTAALDTLTELHLRRWKSVGESGTLGQPGFRQFLRELALREAEQCPFRLYIMEDGGTPIAAMLNFHYGNSALQYQNGFDPECRMAPHSPGTALILYGMRKAIEEGLTYYDFLRGAEAYKFHFARHSHSTQTLLVARTLRARAFLLGKDVRGWLAQLKPRPSSSELDLSPAGSVLLRRQSDGQA
jgi:CelD/BcsL family acetyltransferase involved in cellulose biosynthesis